MSHPPTKSRSLEPQIHQSSAWVLTRQARAERHRLLHKPQLTRVMHPVLLAMRKQRKDRNVPTMVAKSLRLVTLMRLQSVGLTMLKGKWLSQSLLEKTQAQKEGQLTTHQLLMNRVRWILSPLCVLRDLRSSRMRKRCS